MSNHRTIVPEAVVMSKIFLIRQCKVMLDHDLADLYDVETRALKQAVRRNIKRFPEDFMFELTKEEFDHLRSQNVTSSWGGARYVPMAFTEQGVAMLSSVLKSDRAIQVNIQIIRIFMRIREMLLTHKELVIKMNELEATVSDQSESIRHIFSCLKELITEKGRPVEPIGFKTSKERSRSC